MKKILIFGNSGSGKSTLAKNLKEQFSLAHLDLDSLAWMETMPPQRKPLAESSNQINIFTQQNNDWVIEGCYSDLLEIVKQDAEEIIFLNPGTETCIENCRSRPWEPHKYASKKEQDDNLEMLINWVTDYCQRKDEFSLASHKQFFEGFKGTKSEYNQNLQFEISSVSNKSDS